MYQANLKSRDTFTVKELEEILNERVDLKLVEALCKESKNGSGMINSVSAMIRSYSARSGDENEIGQFLRESLNNEKRI